MPGRQESFRRAQKINQGVFGRETTVLIGVAPHLEVQGPGSIRHQYAWVALLRKLYLFLSVVVGYSHSPCSFPYIYVDRFSCFVWPPGAGGHTLIS